MLCNISQNAMGQTLGGYPAGGVPCRKAGTLLGGVPCQGGGTLLGGYPPGGYPGQVRMEGTLPGGVGYPGQVPPGQVRMGGYPAWGVPWSGTPPPARTGRGYLGRTTEGVLNTRRAVCLLRSRRRTFLFVFFSQTDKLGPTYLAPSSVLVCT